MTRARLDARNSRGMPNVGENLAVYVFQFIQVRDSFVACVDFESPCDPERNRVDKLQLIRAIAEAQRGFVVRKTPAFRFVVKLSDLAEGAHVIDESDF